MGKQTNLHSFFKTVASPAKEGGDSSPSKKPAAPKFRLKLTKVLKKVQEAVQGNDEESYTPPVFAVGTLVAFEDETYTVEFDALEIPDSPHSSSSNGSPSKSVASAHNDKTEETWTEQQVSEGVKLYKKMGTKIAKKFDAEIFTGEVKDISYDSDNGDSALYRILYEDGDYEDFSDDQLYDGIKLYEKEQKKKAKKPAAKKRVAPKKTASTATVKSAGGDRSKRARKSYKEDSDDDVEMADKDDDDDDFNPGAAGGDSPDASDDQLDADMLVDTDDEDDDKPAAKKKTKRASKPAAATAKKKTVTETTKKGKKDKASTPEAIMAAFEQDVKKKSQGFKPNNNPQNLPKHGDYVDPVGVDPTYGIVEGIVAAQVKKVGKLLEMVKTANHQNGELTYPIDLQTACSGTDAPSIALDLISQSFNKMAPGNPFAYEHHMSCEIEPFKQGYISNNFPGTTLFPDITKLSETDSEGTPKPVADVYGRLQDIPRGNLFIAGTSCKDFSMLKTTYRKDIEDKGQSGETFLAAVEFLEVYQPPFAIFENVDKAPWGKMANYIEGRISLAERNDDSGITTKNSKMKKDDADNDLVFVVNKECKYEALKIPPQIGMKGGAIVEGIVKEGHDSHEVKPIVAEKQEIGKEITLGQLAKKHRINLDGDTLILEKKARYCTHLVQVDTKNFGLPQTRQRKYLFIWRSDDADDNLGEYFEVLIDHLKTPLLHSIEAFLLPDTHDRIRCFREALRSGPGLMVARERAKENDFWDPMTQVKDTALHYVFRQKNGIPERMRWLTQWGVRGQKKLAPGLWPELFDCWNMRRLDMIDCFAGAFFRDAIARDPNHHLMMWDISQNVTRAPYRSATPGVSGCVTPGGENVLPHKGRSLMGYEKLLLQGIPFSRLTLGRETEVQLSDLAGNAMSLSVVSAMILAAICAPQLRKQCKSIKSISMDRFSLSVEHDDAKGNVLAERGDLHKVENDDMVSAATDFEEAFQPILSLAHDAYRSSVLCTCESSGTSTESKILQCSGCGWRCCHSCTDRYQTTSHDLREHVMASDESPRPDPHEFQNRLRRNAPALLRLGKGAESILQNGDGLESYSFQMQQVERRSGYWELAYGAYEDFGAGRQVAEIRVNCGRILLLDNDVGVAAHIRCFAPSIRDVKPLRGKLGDSARLFLKAAQSPGFIVPGDRKKVNLRLVGKDPCKSLRAVIGLDKKCAADALKNHKVTSRFTLPIQSRNPITHYPSNWKEWPGTIEVSGDPSNGVNGVYRKLDCQHTVVLSALWRRESANEDSSGPMYLFYRPNVLRCGLDVAVFSTSPSYADNQEVVELEDWIPENTFDEKKQVTTALLMPWKKEPSLTVKAPTPTIRLESLSSAFPDSLTSGPGSIVQITNLSQKVVQSLLEYGVDRENETVLDLFGKVGTQCAKRLSIVAAPSLLKFAAEGSLSLTLGQWYSLPVSHDLGRCEVNVPTRPPEIWQQRGNNDGYERVYDPQRSDEYYSKLVKRPKPWTVAVKEVDGSLIVRCNPIIAAHRARALLPGDSNDDIEVAYQVAEYSSMAEPNTEKFKIPNSDAYAPVTFDEDNGLLLPLYPRQAKAVTRMIDIEKGRVEFNEEERSEHTLPGVDWCLIAKASRKTTLRGGVLGDAIGSGKTVIVIGLILKQIQKARANSNPKSGRSSATLIVVPPGLVNQWLDEVKKFTGSSLRSIIVHNTQSLRGYTVKDICKADIVIAPAGLLEERHGTKGRPYTENLTTKAGVSTPIPPAPGTSTHKEAPTIEGVWVRNMSSGPEIYVGNKSTQRHRDNLAYYSHRYHDAIAKLREKQFSPDTKGVPLEWFLFERIIIDECHETLVTGKDASKLNDFKDDAKRGAREFLGVSQPDASKRPLLAASGVWGLSGTPLLETEARVTELANLCASTYVTGAAHHWRKDEAYSARDMFLSQVEENKSREYRKIVSDSAHSFVRIACQRNKGEKLNVNFTREQACVRMSGKEGEQFLNTVRPLGFQTFGVSADQLGEKTIDVLSLTAASLARHNALLGKIHSILANEPETKIIVFATSLGYQSASHALKTLEGGFCKVSNDDSVEKQNEIIAWFRHEDVTEEEKARPRILLLDFAQAAGHNLQEACHSVIIFDPYYTGTDAVGDASVEEQAIGRVFRQGQRRDVIITRIVLHGPEGQDSVDKWIIDRNLSEEVLAAATSNFD